MTPNQHSQDAPIIATLMLDDESSMRLDVMRRTWFPRHRNFIAAHLTLFHALPAGQSDRIREDVRSLAADTAPFSLSFPGVRFLGYGVAADVVSSELLQLRRHLVAQWSPLLSRQDQQTFRPHVTLQNKVTSDAARELFTRLKLEWTPWCGTASGLQLHWYRGGPWELMETVRFAER